MSPEGPTGSDVAVLPDPLPIEPLSAEVDATIRLPGSKSITNRALICAALAPGESTLTNVLFSEDTEAMIGCLRDLGVGLVVDRTSESIVVTGGAEGFDGAVLDARMSGTTARFIAPFSAVSATTVVLDGAPEMRARPMGDLLESLGDLGCDITDLGDPGHLPVEIRSPKSFADAVTVSGDVSSQFLSGLLLSAPALARGLAVSVDTPLVSVPYVAMTIAVMRAFGAEVSHDEDYRSISVGPRRYSPTDYAIEPDASAASYFLAAAAARGGTVRIPGLGRGSLQGDVAFAEVLARMGAEVEIGSDSIVLRSEGELSGISVDMGDISDTAQTLAAIAPMVSGPVEVEGIGFIRAKETDRLAAVVAELRRLGIHAEENPDGFTVQPGAVSPGVVETYSDHRMAMSFAVLGLLTPGVEIADPGCVSKTFPEFWTTLSAMRGSHS